MVVRHGPGDSQEAPVTPQTPPEGPCRVAIDVAPSQVVKLKVEVTAHLVVRGVTLEESSDYAGWLRGKINGVFPLARVLCSHRDDPGLDDDGDWLVDLKCIERSNVLSVTVDNIKTADLLKLLKGG